MNGGSPRAPLDLTKRQLEVLELLARHKRRKEISFELGVTEHTVRAHVDAIRNRLRVASVTEAVRQYLEWLGSETTPPNYQYTISGISPPQRSGSDEHTEPLDTQSEPAQIGNSNEDTASACDFSPRELTPSDPVAVTRPSALYLARLSVDAMPFPQFAIAILLTTVGLVVLTALCVLILIGVFQAVQSFSGQTG